jgi:mono/diheme cytochrome c family protein
LNLSTTHHKYDDVFSPLTLRLSKGGRSSFESLRTSGNTPPNLWTRVLKASRWLVLVLLCVAGCRQDMHDQPRYKPFGRSALFDDQRASRPILPGTVARGQLHDDEVLHTGRSEAGFAEQLPVTADRALFERGRERYDIFCSPCHDRTGTGRGMIVLRGYKQPTSFHTERLREMPPGYLFHVITSGFGVMPAYAAQVPVADRWAIVAYVRALQRSQHAALADVPPGERGRLDSTGASKE